MTNRWGGCKEVALQNLGCKTFVTGEDERGRKKSRVLLNLLVSFQNSMRQQIPSLVAAKQVLFIWKRHEAEAQSFVIATLEVKMMKRNDGFHHHTTNEFLQQPLLGI